MVIGVIGGSGLYQLTQNSGERCSLLTPYGKPSGDYTRIPFGSNEAIFLPRHGEGHTLLPSEINYRANIFGFKKLGAEIILSISAVGSLREEIHPGDFVLPSQYIDFTKGIRPYTFFGNGVVAHGFFADPTCGTLLKTIEGLAHHQGLRVHSGGTYVCIEGPLFSTRAESEHYRSLETPKTKISVIGMTALPEARLAREAGMCYQTIACATDYDCWRPGHEDVTVEMILKVLHQNVDTSRHLVSALLTDPVPPCRSGCRELMKNSVVTPKNLWPKNRMEELDVILG